jgi:hypothetical protein
MRFWTAGGEYGMQLKFKSLESLYLRHTRNYQSLTALGSVNYPMQQRNQEAVTGASPRLLRAYEIKHATSLLIRIRLVRMVVIP